MIGYFLPHLENLPHMAVRLRPSVNFEDSIYLPIPRGTKFYNWNDVSELETWYKHQLPAPSWVLSSRSHEGGKNPEDTFL